MVLMGSFPQGKPKNPLLQYPLLLSGLRRGHRAHCQPTGGTQERDKPLALDRPEVLQGGMPGTSGGERGEWPV